MLCHQYAATCVVTCVLRFGYTWARTRANNHIRMHIVALIKQDTLTCSRNAALTHLFHYVRRDLRRHLRSCTRTHALQLLHLRVATYGLSYLAIHDRVHGHAVAR